MSNAKQLNASDLPFSLQQVLSCPQCGESLDEDGKNWFCSNNHRFPEVGKIPWLFRHPEAKAAEWRWHLDLQLGQIEAKVNQLKQEQNLPDLLSATKKRLARLIQGYQEHKKSLQQILSPLGRLSGEIVKGSEAWTAKIPVTQSITSYFENLHRDWGETGAEENRICAELVLSHLDRRQENLRILTLGAGGCRLSYDVHCALTNPVSVALDINPLLFLVAKRILTGRGISLMEFPLHPIELEKVFVSNKLGGVKGNLENFHLVFGDGIAPPFQPHSYDVVLTPWFIDIIPQDLREMVKTINKQLRPGGRWINFGPLGIRNPAFSRRYTKEEFQEAALAAGFEELAVEVKEIPYLKTPGAHSYRMEQVVIYSGKKCSEADEPMPYSYLPNWLTDHTKPVPLTPSLHQFMLQHEAYYLMGRLIDGKRTVAEMGEEIAKIFKLSPEQGRESVINVFTQIVDGYNFKH